MLNYSELRHRTPDFNDDYYSLTSKCMSSDGRLIATAINDNAYHPTFNDEWEAEEYYESLQYAELRPHIKIWDIWAHKMVKKIRNHDAFMVRFSNNNKHLVSCGYNFIKVWDTETWNIVNEIKYEDRIINIIFSPDNNHFIVATSGYSKGKLHVYNTNNFSVIKIIDITISKELCGMYSPDLTIKKDDNLLFNYDGEYLIFSHSWQSTGCIMIWNTNSWEVVKTIGDIYIRNIVASSDSNLIAIDKSDKGISIMNLENFDEKTAPVKGNESFKTEYPSVMVFSPDNRYLFVHGGYIEGMITDRNGRCIFPDYDKTKCLAIFSTRTMIMEKCYKNIDVKWMDFNSDGDLIIGYDKNIKAIDIERWSEIFDIKGIGYLGNDIEYNYKNEILAMNMNEKYILLLHTTRSSLEKYVRRERSREDYFEFDYRDEIGEYDFDAAGTIEIGGGYNRHGYNRDGYDEDGLDEWGYDEDRNGAYDD